MAGAGRLVALVGGLVMAAAATGRRTAAAFPAFVARHGFDAIVYSGRRAAIVVAVVALSASPAVRNARLRRDGTSPAGGRWRCPWSAASLRWARRPAS